MFKVGYAQEIITPPTGVGLAGYFNKRPNEGMYDDLYVKVIMIETNGKLCGFVSFELCSVPAEIYTDLEAFTTEKYGKELYQNLIVCATHTHTAPEIRFHREEWDDRTYYAYDLALDGAKRAITRAIMNLLPAELEVGSVYNNPYAFIRRYYMKNGTIVTNPGWGNPDIEKPESELDRTISFLKIIQGGRIAALICNISNHGAEALFPVTGTAVSLRRSSMNSKQVCLLWFSMMHPVMSITSISVRKSISPAIKKLSASDAVTLRSSLMHWTTQ